MRQPLSGLSGDKVTVQSLVTGRLSNLHYYNATGHCRININEDLRLNRRGDKSGEKTHAIDVLRKFDMIMEHIDRNSAFGFKTAVNRLELLVKEHH